MIDHTNQYSYEMLVCGNVNGYAVKTPIAFYSDVPIEDKAEDVIKSINDIEWYGDDCSIEWCDLIFAPHILLIDKHDYISIP